MWGFGYSGTKLNMSPDLLLVEWELGSSKTRFPGLHILINLSKSAKSYLLVLKYGALPN